MTEFAPSFEGRGDAGSEYEVVYTNFKTGAILGTVPHISLSASAELNRAETISVTVPIVFDPVIETPITTDTSTLHSLNNFEPWTISIYIVRDGAYLYGGPLIGISNIDLSSETMVLEARGPLAYLGRRNIRTTLSFSNDDQDEIAKTIVNQASGVAIETAPTTLHGISRDRNYLGEDLRNVAEVLIELSQVQRGFDFYFSHAEANNIVTSTFHTVYPANGRATNIVVDQELMSSMVLSKDGSSAVNFADAVGGTAGDVALIESAYNTASTAVRPQLDTVTYHPSVTRRETLLEHAERAIQRGTISPVRASVTKRPNAEPAVNTFIIGDRVRLRAKLGAVNEDRIMRIIGESLSVDGTGKEMHALNLAGIEIFTDAIPEEIVPDF